MTNTSMTNHNNSKQKCTAVAGSFSISSASGNMRASQKISFPILLPPNNFT
jgi:hypothetical protein